METEYEKLIREPEVQAIIRATNRIMAINKDKIDTKRSDILHILTMYTEELFDTLKTKK